MRSPRTLFATATQIVESEGIAALWRGVVPRSIIIGCGSMVFWPAYHHAKKMLSGTSTAPDQGP